MTEDKDARLLELNNWVEHFEWRYVKEHYPHCKILDFGCGMGFLDIYLAREGFDVYGYDTDDERLEVAQYLKEHEIESVKNRLRLDNKLPNEKFDLVWLSHTLEHITEEQFPNLFQVIESYNCPILISVPLDHHYDMPLHVNYWKTDVEFLDTLSKYSKRSWTAWIDDENVVIKARTM